MKERRGNEKRVMRGRVRRGEERGEGEERREKRGGRGDGEGEGGREGGGRGEERREKIYGIYDIQRKRRWEGVKIRYIDGRAQMERRGTIMCQTSV